MVSQAELISKGYHSLVPGLISVFLETVWVPSVQTLVSLFLTFSSILSVVHLIKVQKIEHAYYM